MAIIEVPQMNGCMALTTRQSGQPDGQCHIYDMKLDSVITVPRVFDFVGYK